MSWQVFHWNWYLSPSNFIPFSLEKRALLMTCLMWIRKDFTSVESIELTSFFSLLWIYHWEIFFLGKIPLFPCCGEFFPQRRWSAHPTKATHFPWGMESCGARSAPQFAPTLLAGSPFSWKVLASIGTKNCETYSDLQLNFTFIFGSVPIYICIARNMFKQVKLSLLSLNFHWLIRSIFFASAPKQAFSYDQNVKRPLCLFQFSLSICETGL